MDHDVLTPRAYDKTGKVQMAEAPLDVHQGRHSGAQFVVHHYDLPDVTDQTGVEITTLHGKSRSVGIAELAGLPTRDVTAVIECAGNGRGLLDRRAPGNQFGLGLFYQATWTGVAVSDLLGDAAQEDWTTLVVNGTDEGVTMPEAVYARFGKGLPRQKALHQDTILAWQVNGSPLASEHGGPLRLVVPGWFGIWWVKWVRSLELSAAPYAGFWQRERYTYQAQDGTVIAPVAQQLPRAVLLTPQDNARILDESEVSVVAWAGEHPVAAVEFTVDDGTSWLAAELVEPADSPFMWSRYRAKIPGGLPRGRRRLAVRAIDTQGRTQQWQPATNRLGYGNNGIHIVDVDLVPAAPAGSPERQED